MGVGKDFPTWINNRIQQYGFEQDKDFVVVEELSSPNLTNSKCGSGEFSPNWGKTSEGGRPSIEYHLAAAMANPWTGSSLLGIGVVARSAMNRLDLKRQMWQDRPATMKNDLAIFEGHGIRRIFDEKTETWFFSVVDIIQVLTQQADYQTARKYWNKLKERLRKEGSESVTNCHRLKLPASDGKSYLTDVANAETLLRLVQSVPSPKAEPIKLWLARTGYERMQEMSDPALALERARATWQKHGRSEKWIQHRMTGQETRNKLTDYWAGHDVKKGEEFAILTNIIHQEWSGLSVKSHKELKGIKNQNLRDHMSEAELIFTALAELSTRQIAETVEATGLAENQTAAKTGGKIAKRARLELEAKTGKRVVTGENYLPPSSVKRIRDV